LESAAQRQRRWMIRIVERTFLSILQRTLFFDMGLFSAVAFDVLSTCLAKAATMWALRYRPALPVYVDEGTV